MYEKVVSPSRITQHRRCKRYFYYAYVDKIPTPKSPAMELGTNVHAQIEDYLNLSKVPDDTRKEGRIAMAAIPYLPSPPVSAEQVEQWAEIPLSDVVRIVGRIDFTEQTPHGYDHPRITDFKTSSNFKYAKTEEQLLADPQSIIYCTASIRDADRISFRHLYLKTHAPHYVREVEITFTKDELREAFNTLVDNDIAGLLETMDKGSASDVEPDYSACGDYGGCPFKNMCSEIGDGTYDYLSPILSNKEADTMALPPLKKRQTQTVEKRTEVKTVGSTTGELTPINPPTSEEDVKRYEEALEDNRPMPHKWKKGELVDFIIQKASPEIFNEKPASKWRKAQLVEVVLDIQEGNWDSWFTPTTEEVVVEEVEEVEEVEKEAQSTTDEPVMEVAQEGYSLYINCIPDTEFIRLEKILWPLMDNVANDREDGRPGEFYSTMDYGRGRSRVAALLAMERPRLSGAIVCDRTSPCCAAALEVLIPRASHVVVGF